MNELAQNAKERADSGNNDNKVLKSPAFMANFGKIIPIIVAVILFQLSRDDFNLHSRCRWRCDT